MKRTLFTAIVVTSLLAVPAAAQGPGRTLTIAASAPTVKFGAPVTLSGKLGGSNVDGRNVRVDADPFPIDSFDTAGNTDTNATGDWTLAVTPAQTTRYRARSGNTESGTVDVLVRPALTLRLSDRTPRAGTRVRFFGRVCPEHDGVKLAIQRRRAGTWRTVRRAVLQDVAGSACSKFSRRLRVRRDGAYRARFHGDADHAAGNSRVRRANAHR
jgi:hypothetical protein